MRSSEHESLLVGAWRLTATVDRAEEVHMLWIGPNDEVTSDDGAALSATPLRSGKWKAKRDADGLAMDLLFGIGSGHTPLSLIGRGAIDNGTVVFDGRIEEGLEDEEWVVRRSVAPASAARARLLHTRLLPSPRANRLSFGATLVRRCRLIIRVRPPSSFVVLATTAP